MDVKLQKPIQQMEAKILIMSLAAVTKDLRTIFKSIKIEYKNSIIYYIIIKRILNRKFILENLKHYICLTSTSKVSLSVTQISSYTHTHDCFNYMQGHFKHCKFAQLPRMKGYWKGWKGLDGEFSFLLFFLISANGFAM